MQDETVGKSTLWTWLFSFKGRVDRRGFMVRLVLFFTVGFSVYGFDLAGSDSETWPVWILPLYLLWLVVWLASFAAYVSAIVRRAHDLGSSGWAGLWLFAPLVGFVMILKFMLEPGDSLPNEYGRPPRVPPGQGPSEQSPVPAQPAPGWTKLG